MASAFGRNRGMVCPACQLEYDKMRTGDTFKTIRREIISIGYCTKRGKTKYGRRHGTLGYWHEKKMMLWDQHVGMCTDAAEAAERKAS